MKNVAIGSLILCIFLSFFLGKNVAENNEPTPVQSMIMPEADTVFVEIAVPFDTCMCEEWKVDVDSLKQQGRILYNKQDWTQRLILQRQVAEFKREHIR